MAEDSYHGGWSRAEKIAKQIAARAEVVIARDHVRMRAPRNTVRSSAGAMPTR